MLQMEVKVSWFKTVWLFGVIYLDGYNGDALDFKHPLNLTKTDFPMRANLSELEPRMLKKWWPENDN
jgi:hypothetical protein